MNYYEDTVVRLDPDGITVKNSSRPNKARHIPYSKIRTAELIKLGFGSGKYRLVGFSPLRPRHYFHWDPKRASKASGISLDLGGLTRSVITPDDPEQLLSAIHARI